MDIDLKSIYSIACTVGRAETVKAKKIQNVTLRDLIKKSLKNDHTELIYEAIALCEQNNKHYERQLIENHYVELVSTLYTNEGMINARTDLVLFPILVKSANEIGKIANIASVEEAYEKTLKDNYLLPAASNIHLYSVFFNQEKVNSFTLADWYKLHLRMVFSRDKSIEQTIYKKPFGMNLTSNKTSLVYFVGLIYQNRKLVESVEPELFDRRQMNIDDKKNFLSQINAKFKEFSKSTEYEVLMPDDIFRSIDEAKFHYQEKMIHYFIDQNTKKPNTEYFIASLENSICFFAYNNETRKVYDKMKLITVGNHSDQENIDFIFDSLADNKTYVYIAKDHQPDSFYDNSDSFDLEKYLANNPYDKLAPNHLDNSDFYL